VTAPRRRPRLAISLGDPSGVGPEVTAAALARLRGAAPLLFGDASAAEPLAAAGLSLPVVAPGAPLPRTGALVAVTRLARRDRLPGKPSAAGGAAQLAYLAAAFEAVRGGAADALCTAPVSKAQVQRALPGFVGHTEWLEARFPRARSVMMLACERLRIALVTNHVALARVPRAVTAARTAETLAVTYRALRDDLGVARPRLALCALNPHGGEGGAFGDEEARVLAPALAAARRGGTPAEGPFPADGLMFKAAAGAFDAVVALYHDQGLVAVKLLDALGDPAVNVTLGLPIVRTSPDHGTAYDLAGTGRARPDSMEAALRLAADIAVRRRARAAGDARAGAPAIDGGRGLSARSRSRPTRPGPGGGSRALRRGSC
jgi:4-hydroxythreonine-4-phosphate dehydrogenase